MKLYVGLSMSISQPGYQNMMKSYAHLLSHSSVNNAQHIVTEKVLILFWVSKGAITTNFNCSTTGKW